MKTAPKAFFEKQKYVSAIKIAGILAKRSGRK